MIRAALAVAAIMFISTGAVASAQVETQTASAEPTISDHNGSVVYLIANGQSREFHYQRPRAGMFDVGTCVSCDSDAVKHAHGDAAPS